MVATIYQQHLRLHDSLITEENDSPMEPPLHTEVQVTLSIFPELPLPADQATIATYKASSFYGSCKSGIIYAMMFPKLFPQGTGHPGSPFAITAITIHDILNI